MGFPMPGRRHPDKLSGPGYDKLTILNPSTNYRFRWTHKNITALIRMFFAPTPSASREPKSLA